jgi:hypothetical protein
MVSPSEVVAQNHQESWRVARRVASAKLWQIPDIISEAIATNPGAVAEIVERSITVRTEASETILVAALQAAPEEASRLTGVAVRVFSERQAAEPAPTQMVSQQVDPNQLNKQIIDIPSLISDFDPFDPDAGEELTERILAATCQVLGDFSVGGFVDFCVSPAN